MILRFNKDLTRENIFANGKELATIMGYDRDEKGNRIYTLPEEVEEYVTTIKNPVLITDNYRINKLKPTNLRDTVLALFATPKKITEYITEDGKTSLEFEQAKYNGVWGPSIDTLLFCRGLEKEKEEKNLENIKDAIEIGSGSGFISKYLLNNLQNLEKIILIDLNKKAEECASYNINDKRAELITGNGVEYLKEKDKKYDLIICNPPYIPRPKSIGDNAYEGDGLLSYLIDNANKYLKDDGIFLTNISSLCENRIYDVIKQANVKARKIDSLKVPLKVYNVLNNEEWMDYLLKEKGLMKPRLNKRGYDYWHIINITEIRNK